MINRLGREGLHKPYGLPAADSEKPNKNNKEVLAEQTHWGLSLEEVLDALPLTDGMTLSFHHHLRNGDYVLQTVMEAVHKRGVKDLTIAASSIFPAHECLVPMLEDGTVTKIHTAYMSGPVADAVSKGKCREICEITTHGGRPRAILAGELAIDVSFIASPAVDKQGNITGSDGPGACGVLGYAVADAKMAKRVVAVTDTVLDRITKPEIDHKYVDYIVAIDSIGDPQGIVSGTTQVTKDPVGLKIAKDCATLMLHSGLLKNGFSFQTGAGGISLAVADFVKEEMKEQGITARFASGGITDYLVDMLEDGAIETLYDVQCFNLKAVESVRQADNHVKIDADRYANPDNPDNIVDRLDFVILGATEIDTDFHVNVTTGTDGKILGGSGGHADTAAGAKLSIIVSKLVNARVSCLVDAVTTITTPGETVDILVTDRGIAIHPKHTELIEKLQKETHLEILPIKDLLQLAKSFTGEPEPVKRGERMVAASVYRDGTVLDVLYQIEE